MVSEPTGDDPTVSIVIVPRDRFSLSPRTLRSLLANTRPPYQLVYVDAGSPADVRDELAAMARRHGFTLIRREDYGCPNRSRNIGLAEATGELVVVAENDVLFTPRWLEPLIECVRQTGADVVSPVILMGEPRDQKIHFVGGELIEQDGPAGTRLRDIYWHTGRTVGEVKAQLRRQRSAFSELHCTLIRRDLLARIGPFDETLQACQEHIDFGLAVRRAGGVVYSEPGSQVSFYDGGLFTLADIAPHGLRWGTDWVDRSAEYFARKWQLDPGCTFFETFYQWMDWHRENRQWWHPIRRSAEAAAGIVAAPPPAGAPDLFAALPGLGYSAEQIAGIVAAWETAEALFAGQGQPRDLALLTQHLATGARLARHGAPPAAVIAGLLHDAIGSGGFPAEAGRSPGSRQEWLRARVGEQATSMIMACARIAFDAEDNACDGTELDRLPVELALVIAIRTAAEIEQRAAGRAVATSSVGAGLFEPGGLAERVLPRLWLGDLGAELLHTPAASRPAALRDPTPGIAPRSLRRVADPLAGIPRDAELIGIATVKNESDIIEAFVRYNLRVLDGLAIINHASSDGTGAILQRLCDEGLPLMVADEGGPAQLQAQRVTELLGRIRAARRPLLVFALDGDEMIRVADRDTLIRAAAACPADRVPALPWMTYMPTVDDDPGEIDPLRRLRHRRAFEPTLFHKVVLARPQIDDDRVRVGDGNHQLLDAAGKEIPSMAANDVVLAHFPVRCSDQIRAKAFIGMLASRLDHLRGSEHGHFWATMANRLLPRVDLRSQRGLQELAATYSTATGAPPVLDPLPDIPYESLAYVELMEVDGLGRVIDYVQEAVGPLTRNLDGQQAAIAGLKSEADRLRAANRHLAQQIASLRESRSWRLTEPIRRGSTLMRRVLGR